MTSDDAVHSNGPAAASEARIEADVVVVGAGLAGLVAAAEAYAAGRRVAVLDQEPEASAGGQAHWSFGGLFLVNTPEQRRLGVRDSAQLALADWLSSAAFDRPEDALARQWAEAYVDFAAGEKRAWLASLGVGLFPLVQWAERGGYGPDGHGNTVPRFHVAWGTGPALVAPFLSKLREGEAAGRVSFHFRHRATGLVKTAGRVSGVRGELLEASGAGRGESSSRRPDGTFEAAAAAVVVTSGGIGGNHDVVRKQWRGGGADVEWRSGIRGRGLPPGRGPRRRTPHQRGPDVALPGGYPQPCPGLAAARHPDPARTVGPVAGRDGADAPASPVSGLRFARRPAPHPGHGTCPFMVRPEPQHRAEGVRAVRIGAEPGSHGQGRPAAGLTAEARQRYTAAAVPGPRGRLFAGSGPRRAGRADERF